MYCSHVHCGTFIIWILFTLNCVVYFGDSENHNIENSHGGPGSPKLISSQILCMCVSIVGFEFSCVIPMKLANIDALTFCL